MSQWIVFNPVNGAGYLWTFGLANQSIPVPAPYAGFGTADLAVYVPSSGTWYSVNTTTWTLSTTVYGGPAFEPVPADYDGDGRADIGLYYPALGQWLIIPSTTGTAVAYSFGEANVDQPDPLDYDGDGKADLSVFRPTTSTFYARLTSTGVTKITTVGPAGVEEPALAPWAAVDSEVQSVGNAPSAHPAFVVEVAATPSTAAPAAASVASAPAPSAPLLAVPVVVGRTPVAQAIKSKFSS
jgi:hypothetical protein